jgi:hypothetical protein
MKHFDACHSIVHQKYRKMMREQLFVMFEFFQNKKESAR